MAQNDFVSCAGILLTGGASRRMGRDKASIPWPGSDSPTLAVRTAALLTEVCAETVEVGPGHTKLPRAEEATPGSGPLAAMVAGWEHLMAARWTGPVLVVATDLPLLTEGLLAWLSDHPGVNSVVPSSGGRVQPLCARYSQLDMATARRLVAGGERAVKALIGSIDAVVVPEGIWGGPAGGAQALRDADTPLDLRRAADL